MRGRRTSTTGVSQAGRRATGVGGTYADNELFGIDEIVVEDGGKDGRAKLACGTCESKHFEAAFREINTSE
jgi:hypothetical protein